MNAEIERFTGDINTKPDLRSAIKAAGTDNAAIVKAANAKGYNFTVGDVEKLIAEGELTDSQLASVAGGAVNVFTWKGGTFIHWT